jgi:hypothetical protein
MAPTKYRRAPIERGLGNITEASARARLTIISEHG